jgi:hypothetical protein
VAPVKNLIFKNYFSASMASICYFHIHHLLLYYIKRKKIVAVVVTVALELAIVSPITIPANHAETAPAATPLRMLIAVCNTNASPIAAFPLVTVPHFKIAASVLTP